jgi:hypothetical protein
MRGGDSINNGNSRGQIKRTARSKSSNRQGGKDKKTHVAQKRVNTKSSNKSHSSSKTRMKKRMLRQKQKSMPRKSKHTNHVDLSSRQLKQKPLISESNKFDKKRHFMNTLQTLRVRAEEEYFYKQPPLENRQNSSSTVSFSPLPLTPDVADKSLSKTDEHNEHNNMKNILYQNIKDYEENINDDNNIADENLRIKEAILRLVSLLESHRDEKIHGIDNSDKLLTKFEEKEVRQSLLVKKEAAKRKKAKETKQVFDAMLIDYAKRVHNYKDPTLQDALRPMPLLNMNEKL